MSSPLPTTTSPLKTPPESAATTPSTKLDTIERGSVGEGGGSPPALPPRPPPRPRADVSGGGDVDDVLDDVLSRTVLPRSCWLRKYVFLCTVCGGLAVLLGALFLTVYFMLRTYTSSLHYFETIPTYIPAIMLIVTGVLVMSQATRRNRFSCVIKCCGSLCLMCAVLCVAVTVTTTVFHMSRLQSLRECVFTQKTQTCTCYSVLLDSTSDRGDEGVRYIFNSTPDCEVIHGALYSCLRAMFGLSVIGILVCIFSCMLVYQLLSHEKKKMYWEQLELRCRYLTHAQRTQHCACCAECRHPGGPGPMGGAHHEMFPWELDDRYWSPRVGNLYSPNPGQVTDAPMAARRSAWSWRRLPWTRATTSPALAPSNVTAVQTTGCMSAGQPRTLRHSTASPDSQYGFSSSRNPAPPSPSAAYYGDPAATSFYTWGPPPPYSSPCRQQPLLNLLQRHRSPQRVLVSACHGRRCSGGSTSSPQRSPCARSQDDSIKQRATRRLAELQAAAASASDSRSNDNYVNTEDRVAEDPAPVVRKTKKLGSGLRTRGCPMFRDDSSEREESEGYEGLQQPVAAQCCHGQRCCRDGETPPRSPRIVYLVGGEGVANKAFEGRETAASTAPSRPPPEPTESEVYFGDVSSCCAASVRADPTAQDGFIYDEAVDHGCHAYQPTSPNIGRHSPESAFHPISPDHSRSDFTPIRHEHRRPDHHHRHLYTSPTFPEDLRPRPPYRDHEPEEPEDNVLRSNCFTYQMFSKRPQWDDVVDAETECASCSTSEAATPVTDTTFASPSTPCVGGDPLSAFYAAEGGGRDAERLAPDAQYERSLGPSADEEGVTAQPTEAGEEEARRMPSTRRKEGDVVRSVNV